MRCFCRGKTKATGQLDSRSTFTRFGISKSTLAHAAIAWSLPPAAVRGQAQSHESASDGGEDLVHVWQAVMVCIRWLEHGDICFCWNAPMAIQEIWFAHRNI